MTYELVAQNCDDPTRQILSIPTLDFQPLWAFVHAREYVPVDVFLAVAQGALVNIRDERAREIGDAIVDDIDGGRVDEFVDAHRQLIESLDLIECEACDGTGIRTDEMARKYGLDLLPLDDVKAIALGRERGTCNLCDGWGKHENPLARFRFDVATVRRFAEFLRTCGGCSITNERG